MPKLSANNYRVFIESATTGSFNVVAGQISHTIDRGEVSYSTVDKASTVEVTERAMRNYAMSMEYRPDLPDANGHARLETIYASGASAGVQVRKSPFASGDVVFACIMRVASMGASSPLNDVHATTVSLTPTAAPSTDLLA
jgi:hypothetical protein